MNEWLKSSLACPRDKKALSLNNEKLTCPDDHVYPVVFGIPVMLVPDAESTHGYIERTLKKVVEVENSADDYAEEFDQAGNKAIDEFVQQEIPYTSGNLYFPAQNRLTRYPIPETRLWQGNGERLLDIGCNWGRWSISAAQKGFKPVGLDPSLEAVLAARRVAKQLGVDADFIVGDARFLPFSENVFDVVFSYSVYQHLSKENVGISLTEVRRVLKPNGKTLFQMPNKFGIRSYQQRRRRGFTEGEGFEVRYWTPAELLETFERKIGKTVMTTDCFFGLGIQKSDVDLLPAKYQAVVHLSEFLRKLSGFFKPLTKVADSVYLESVNQK
ncbi:MAG: methyltransferase domain-containing protein [Pyrinomonadaceae bacterium]|nr:methyltransferase domain-containing protein [Pyrinomonadaceae bacterium]